MNLHGRNLLKETDLTAAEFRYLTDLGRQLRLEKRI
jgi:ornithine carbamoyltransferase